jgi:hypothetical protein
MLTVQLIPFFTFYLFAVTFLMQLIMSFLVQLPGNYLFIAYLTVLPSSFLELIGTLWGIKRNGVPPPRVFFSCVA